LIDNYEHLIERLARLEDLAIGQQAQTNLATSRMVGTEIFTTEIQRWTALDCNDCADGKTRWS
jgi:hypothetical protein